MTELFDIKFIASISMFIALPLSGAYFQALRSAKLPIKEYIFLRLTVLIITVMSISLGFTLIGQIDANSFSALNLIPVFISFIFSRFIQRKFPALFLKLLFNKQLREN